MFRRPWRPFFAAVTFLTRVPLGDDTPEGADLSQASAFFPLVGAILWLFQGTAWYLLSPILGSIPSALLVFAIGAWVTGGLHEDGLADTADAFGGTSDRERALEIFKDSRIGTFGALALIFSVGLRVTLLAHLPRMMGAWALFVMGSLARVGLVWLMVLLPHASPDRSKSPGIWAPRAINAWVASVLGVLPLAAFAIEFDCLPFAALSIGLLVVTWIYFAWRAIRRLSGLVGDVLGATEQVSEIVILASLAAWHSMVTGIGG
jgi:adenosylcobinamide-GDP ribazoletransferase